MGIAPQREKRGPTFGFCGVCSKLCRPALRVTLSMGMTGDFEDGDRRRRDDEFASERPCSERADMIGDIVDSTKSNGHEDRRLGSMNQNAEADYDESTPKNGISHA